MQALEGVLDSASNYLHSGQIRPASGTERTVYAAGKSSLDLDRPSNDGRPRIEVRDAPYGFRYAAIQHPTRNAETSRYVRVTHFIAPFSTVVPAPTGVGWQHMFVPVDDENTMFHYIRFKTDGIPIDADERAGHASWGGTATGVDVDANHRKTRGRWNGWLQDRDAMRRGSFSGITGVQNEDFAMSESMGPRYDRTKEHLRHERRRDHPHAPLDARLRSALQRDRSAADRAPGAGRLSTDPRRRKHDPDRRLVEVRRRTTTIASVALNVCHPRAQLRRACHPERSAKAQILGCVATVHEDNFYRARRRQSIFVHVRGAIPRDYGRYAPYARDDRGRATLSDGGALIGRSPPNITRCMTRR